MDACQKKSLSWTLFRGKEVELKYYESIKNCSEKSMALKLENLSPVDGNHPWWLDMSPFPRLCMKILESKFCYYFLELQDSAIPFWLYICCVISDLQLLLLKYGETV